MKKLPNALSWAQRAGFVFSYFTLSLKCKRINLRCRSNSPENARIQRYPYLFSSTLCAKIHQLSLLSQFAKPGLWLFVSFFQKHIFPIVCSWAAEPPARHKFSLNSPSCSKSDSTTSDLLVTTCSLKICTFPVLFSLLSRQQQFIYHWLQKIPKGLIP